MDNTNNNNYIATWFYKEGKDEASFYPQIWAKGDSPLLHSIYMMILVPFFVTFRKYNPDVTLQFFTNLKEDELPYYLKEMFAKVKVNVITIPYTRRPPKDWHDAWQNQFYLYDIMAYMGDKMKQDDTLLICDADCLCWKSLSGLFEAARSNGSALYEFITDRNANINGITLPDMEDFYNECFKETVSSPITYYGGEFICLRGDYVRMINDLYPKIWSFNLTRKQSNKPKINEEAQLLSIMVERLGIRNNSANKYVKRMWTSPMFNNICKEDAEFSVWHLPYEKKRGLKFLFNLLKRNGYCIKDEKRFMSVAKTYTGIPNKTLKKRIYDFIMKISNKV